MEHSCMCQLCFLALSVVAVAGEYSTAYFALVSALSLYNMFIFMLIFTTIEQSWN